MWCRMSRIAVSWRLEGIDGIGGRRRADVRLKPRAINHIDRMVKESRNDLLQSDVLEPRDAGFGLDIDHDVEIAVRPIIAARDRAEDGRMDDAAGAQRLLVAP